MAVQLGNDQVAKLLEATGNEEEAADTKLKSLAEEEIFPQAAAAGDADEDEDKMSVAQPNRERSAK